MQKIELQISKPVSIPMFLSQWNLEHKEWNCSPDTKFDFKGMSVLAEIKTWPESPWRKDAFSRAVQMVLHKVDSACDILNIREIGL